MQSPRGYKRAKLHGRLQVMAELLSRSTPMELHHRVELLDTLMAETDQKTQSLHHALHAKERAEQTQESSHGAPLTDEEQSLQYEQALWEKAQMGLTEL